MNFVPFAEPDQINREADRWQILIVSDSAVEKKLLVGLLTKHRHHPVVAGGARDALLKWSAAAFDAVIVDPLLTEMPGDELVRAIRDTGHAGRVVPIMIMSEDPRERENCLQAGADACLKRPLPITEFQQLVVEARRRALEAQSARRPVRLLDGHPDSVDWKVALDAVGGRRDLLAELIQIFEEEYPKTLTTIRAVIAAGDPKCLQVSAHQLKGCLRYFGQTTAGSLARGLEDLGRSGTTTGAASQLAPLDAAVQHLLPLIRHGPGNA